MAGILDESQIKDLQQKRDKDFAYIFHTLDELSSFLDKNNSLTNCLINFDFNWKKLGRGNAVPVNLIFEKAYFAGKADFIGEKFYQEEQYPKINMHPDIVETQARHNNTADKKIITPLNLNGVTKRKKKYLKANDFYLGDRIDLMNKIEPNSIDMIITSPPYNVGKDYKNHNDLMEYKDYLKFLNDTWKCSMKVLKEGGRLAINITSMTWGGEWKPLYNDVINQCLKLGFIMRCEILWYKQAMSKRTAWGSWQSPSNPHVIQPYEYIFVFSLGTRKMEGKKEDIDITKNEFIKFSNAFWEIPAETRLSKTHPAPFPEELVYRLLKFYTFKNSTILDMFGGSGTVALVSQWLNRNFIYLDNCEEYLNFAKKRVATKRKFL